MGLREAGGRPRDVRVMLRRHQRWLAGRRFGARRANGSRVLLIRADLADADLQRADLRAQSLREARLRGAGLSRARLEGADLAGADMVGANLSGAHLRGADLRGTRLVEANLAGADLSDAIVRGADLTGAHLAGACLAGVDLRDARLSQTTWGTETVRIGGAPPSRGLQMVGSRLRGAPLAGLDLRGADLTDADLRGADLRGTDLRGASLFRARLRGALLEGARLDGADLAQTSLEGAVTASPERAEEAGDGGRRGARLVWAAGAVALVLVTVVALTQADLIGRQGFGGADAPAPVAAPPPGQAVVSRPTPVAVDAGAPPAPSPASVGGLVIEGTAGTGSWVELREGDATGALIYAATIPPGTSETFPVRRPLWLRLGNTDGVEVTLADRPRDLAGGTASFRVTRGRITRL